MHIRQLGQNLTITPTSTTSLDDEIDDILAVRGIVLNASDTGISLTLPTPGEDPIHTITIVNAGEEITLNDRTIPSGYSTDFIWINGVWVQNVSASTDQIGEFSEDESYAANTYIRHGNFLVTNAEAVDAGTFSWENWEPMLAAAYTWGGVFSSSITAWVGNVVYAYETDSDCLYFATTSFQVGGTSLDDEPSRNLLMPVAGTTVVPRVSIATTSRLSGMGYLLSMDASDTPQYYKTNNTLTEVTEDTSTSGTTELVPATSGDAISMDCDGDLTLNSTDDALSVESTGTITLRTGTSTSTTTPVYRKGSTSGSSYAGSDYYGGVVTATGARSGMSSNTSYTLCSVTLATGVWRVYGSWTWIATSTITSFAIRANLYTSSGTSYYYTNFNYVYSGTAPTDWYCGLTAPPYYVTITASSDIIYLSSYTSDTFSGTVYGGMFAIRAR